MKFKSAMVTQASGSIGGMTFSHNRGGLYIRARSIPTDPATVQQVAIRGFVASLASLWNGLLTPLQREAWDLYALGTEMPDALGEPRNIGGLGHYVRSNVPRLQVGLPRIDDGPTFPGLASFTNPSFDTFDAATNSFNVNFTDSDPWAIAVGGAMLVFASRPQNLSINFFKGPYRTTTTPILGAVIPPTTPDTQVAPFAFAADQKVFVYIRVTDQVGKLSAPFRGFGVGV